MFKCFKIKDNSYVSLPLNSTGVYRGRAMQTKLLLNLGNSIIIIHKITPFKSRKSTLYDLIGGKTDLFDFEIIFYYC